MYGFSVGLKQVRNKEKVFTTGCYRNHQIPIPVKSKLVLGEASTSEPEFWENLRFQMRNGNTEIKSVNATIIEL